MILQKRVKKGLAITLSLSMVFTAGVFSPSGAAAKTGKTDAKTGKEEAAKSGKADTAAKSGKTDSAARTKKTVLSAAKLTVTVGKKKTLKLQGATKKAVWKVTSGKKYIQMTVKKKYNAVILGKKKGKAKVQVTSAGRKYTCKITVNAAKQTVQTASPATSAAVGTGEIPAETAPPASAAPSQAAADSGETAPSAEPEKEKPSPTPEATEDEEGRSLAEIKLLNALIKQINGAGGSVSTDISAKEYTWEQGHLTHIDWAGKSIQGELSFQGLTKLWSIDCSNNQITGIDVSDNTNLIFLRCYKNQLSELDISQNKLLTEVDCSENQITSLKPKGEEMELLHCQSNQITSLNLNKCPNLSHVDCYSNLLKKLDISKCEALEYLDFRYNNISDLTFVLGTHPKLQSIYCNGNEITTWDYSIPSLEYLDCSENGMDLFRGNGMTGLKTLICTGQGPEDMLMSVDLTPMTKLETADFSENSLESIQFAKNKKLKKLRVNSNNFTKVAFQSDYLEELDFSEDDLPEEMTDNEIPLDVDLSGLPALKVLNCAESYISKLDLSVCPELEELNCSGNDLNALDISGNTKLRVLDCSENLFISLEVASASLEELKCAASSSLKLLDISAAPALKLVNCGECMKLISLDISKNAALEKLTCTSTVKASLDTTGHPHLKVDIKDDEDDDGSDD